MAPSMPRKNPRRASEVTKDWLEIVLSHNESKTCPGSIVNVISFQVNPGCGKGDNFNADVTRIEAEAEVTPEHGKPSPRHYSFITKFLVGNEFQQEVAKHFGPPKREMLALSEVLPAFNAFQKNRGKDKYHINAPRHVYGVCTADEYVLVMQDLREAGFHVEDKRRGLDLLHLRMAVRHLAHFHAVSYAFCRTHDFLQKYPVFQENKLMPSVLGAMCQAIFEGVQSALKDREEEFPDELEFLAANKQALASKIVDSTGASGTEALVCLCHGDYWTNNIMFRHSEEGALEDFMMIDWGNASWRSPILDLHYLLNSSTQPDLRKDHLEEVQRQYFDTFTSAAADLGAALPFRGFEDFLTEWRRTAPAGLGLGILVNLVSLSKSGKKLNRGTLSTGLMSTLKTKLARAMIPMMTALPMMTMVRINCKKEFKEYIDELASMENPEMTDRIINLLTEAHRARILDP